MPGSSLYPGKSVPYVRFLGSFQVSGLPVIRLIFLLLTKIASRDDLGLGLNLDSGVPLREGGLNAQGFRILLFVLVVPV